MAKARRSKTASNAPSTQPEVVFPDKGSIYTFLSHDGFHGAVRVAKIVPADPKGQKAKQPWSGNSVGYVTTTYYSQSPPELTDPKLRETFLKTWGNWNRVPENWQAELPVGEEFKLLGVIAPVLDDDQQRFGFGYWQANSLLEKLKRQYEHTTHAGDSQSAPYAPSTLPRSSLAEVNTLDGLLKLPLFANWRNHPRSKKFLVPARQIVRQTVKRLGKLGEKPKLTIVKTELKVFVEQFNRLNKSDPFVETSESDDITEVFCALARIMKLKDDPILLFEKWERF